uniref:Uncharacterized protein n=1 Tax=Gouania willdenowi TaxID=441366 RepID=A0A8C5EJE7_GOUWI
MVCGSKAGQPIRALCRPGFSHNFYTVIVSRDLLHGQSILKGKRFTLRWVICFGDRIFCIFVVDLCVFVVTFCLFVVFCIFQSFSVILFNSLCVGAFL